MVAAVCVTINTSLHGCLKQTAHTDSALLLRISNGEEEAFKLLFHEYFRRLCFFANSLIGNTEDSKRYCSGSTIQDVDSPKNLKPAKI